MNDPMVFKNNLSRFISSDLFENFILATLVVNVVAMAAASAHQSEFKSNVLNVVELLCSFVFIVEMILKLVAYEGLTWYFT